MTEPRYLLLKRGLYYRPNNQGYTGIKENAGRYTKAEGDALVNCGVTTIHEDEADEYTAACFDDVARAHLQAKLAQIKAALIAERQDHVDRYSQAMNECNRYDLQNDTLKAALRKYAHDLCEHGEQSEVCGRLSEAECGGCFARQALGACGAQVPA